MVKSISRVLFEASINVFMYFPNCVEKRRQDLIIHANIISFLLYVVPSSTIKKISCLTSNSTRLWRTDWNMICVWICVCLHVNLIIDKHYQMFVYTGHQHGRMFRLMWNASSWYQIFCAVDEWWQVRCILKFPEANVIRRWMHFTHVNVGQTLVQVPIMPCSSKGWF